MKKKDMFLVNPNEVIIRENFNPRVTINRFGEDEEDKNLISSVRDKGVLHPILVTRKDGKLYLVDGERRLRASREAGLTEISAISMGRVTEEDIFLASIISNSGKPLNPVEEGIAYMSLKKEGMKVEQIAKAVHKSVPTVYARIKIIAETSEGERQKYLDGKISLQELLALTKVKEDKRESTAEKMENSREGRKKKESLKLYLVMTKNNSVGIMKAKEESEVVSAMVESDNTEEIEFIREVSVSKNLVFLNQE